MKITPPVARPSQTPSPRFTTADVKALSPVTVQVPSSPARIPPKSFAEPDGAVVTARDWLFPSFSAPATSKSANVAGSADASRVQETSSAASSEARASVGPACSRDVPDARARPSPPKSGAP